jgi:hypothetical protein
MAQMVVGGLWNSWTQKEGTEVSLSSLASNTLNTSRGIPEFGATMTVTSPIPDPVFA